MSNEPVKLTPEMRKTAIDEIVKQVVAALETSDDAAIVARLHNSNARRVHYVDIGHLPTNEDKADALQKIAEAFKTRSASR